MIQIRKQLCVALISLALLPQAHASAAPAEEEGEGDPKKPKIVYVPLEPAFVTNFQDARIRYLRTDISIKVSNDKTSEAIREHLFAVRHQLVMLLNRQTEQDLRSIEGRTKMAEDAISSVVELLESEKAPTDVQEVLFTTFVME